MIFNQSNQRIKNQDRQLVQINNTLLADNTQTQQGLDQMSKNLKAELQYFYDVIIQKLNKTVAIMNEQKNKSTNKMKKLFTEKNKQYSTQTKQNYYEQWIKRKNKKYQNLTKALDNIIASSESKIQDFQKFKINENSTDKSPVILLDDNIDWNDKALSTSDIQILQNIRARSLKRLSLSNNKIRSIQIFTKIDFPNILHLYLHSNKIKDIEPLTKASFKNLEVLWLNNNRIQSLQPLVNVNFPRLQRLGLFNNKISSIEPLTRVTFPQLQDLNLLNNLYDKKEVQQYKQRIMKCVKNGWLTSCQIHL